MENSFAGRAASRGSEPMDGYWKFRTEYGAFRIVPTEEGWEVFHEDEMLGSYSSAEQALKGLLGGEGARPTAGNAAEFGLPDDLADWEFVRP
jgi:hypothetical protein